MPKFSFVPDDHTKFNVVTIVHSDRAQKPDIQLLNEQFRRKFKPYEVLFGITSYSVVEHSAASRCIPNNMVV